MGNKLKKRDAVVSMIEIMMIFAIIGVVSAAAMGLSKPKAEYMKKMQIYSAYVTLQNAASQIAKEGHIDFTTDINVCENRETTSPYKCLDYENKIPGTSYTLPKVSFRNASGNVDVDQGESITSYSTLSSAQKTQYKLMQDGFCQRLATTLQLNSGAVNCSSLGIDIDTLPTSFSGYTPNLKLPNGQVYYIMDGALSYALDITATLKRIAVASDQASSVVDYTNARKSESELSSVSSDIFSCLDLSSNKDTCFDVYIAILPNETKAKFTKDIYDKIQNGDSATLAKYNTQVKKNFVTYLMKHYEKNKDFFRVYVDVNGKMKNDKDIARGPDKVGEDIYLFNVFRDGTVRPGYETKFPLTKLNGRVVIKKELKQTINDKTTYSNFYVPYGNNGAYSNIPLGFASCYAGVAGDVVYKEMNGTNTSYVGYTARLCYGIKPLNDCISGKCRALVNEPSFFVK